MKLIALLTVVFSISCMSYAGEMRIWTGKNGQTFEAEYTRDASGKVWLKPQTGKTRTIPINALIEEDQDYINKQTLPKIEVDVDDDISRSTVGADIDNVYQEIRCVVDIKKTSKRPYPDEYEVNFYVLAMDIRYKEYFIADAITESFTLNEKNPTYRFKGRDLSFEYDPDPAWGTRYEGYALCVKTKEGITLVTKGPDKFTEQLGKLKKGKVNVTRYRKDFTLSGRNRR